MQTPQDEGAGDGQRERAEAGAGQQAVTAEVDLLARFHVDGGERAGYSSVYRNAKNEPIPVSWAHHYNYRDIRLRRTTPLEFRKALGVRKMTKKDREWWEVWRDNHLWGNATAEEVAGAAAGVAGAAPSARPRAVPVQAGRPCERYVLRAPHPLADSHILVARAKWDTLALAGAPPPKEPKEPAGEVPTGAELR